MEKSLFIFLILIMMVNAFVDMRTVTEIENTIIDLNAKISALEEKNEKLELRVETNEKRARANQESLKTIEYTLGQGDFLEKVEETIQAVVDAGYLVQ